MASQQDFITRPPAQIYGQQLGYGFAGLGVNTAIGNFTHTAADLAFPGSLLGLLNWTRTYNSLSGTAGALGPGWTAAFSSRLVVAPAQGVLHHTAGQVTFYDDDGRVLPFAVAPDGGFVSPQDLNATLVRNTDGSYTLTYLSGQTWSFSSSGQLTGRSAEGQTVTFDYDPSGLLVRAAHSSGSQLSMSYNADRRLTQVAANDGRTVSYAYGANGALQAVTVPGGGGIQFQTTSGTAFPQIATITNADGNQIVANTYDATSNRVSTQAFPTGGGAEFGYDDSTGLTTVTSTPSSAQVSFQADANGRMTKATDPFGNSATFGYDSNGRLTQASTPGGTQLTQSYDANGNVLTSTFGGSTTSWTFDAQNRVTTVTGPDGGVTTYAYAGASHIPVQVTDANGGVTTQIVSDGLILSQTDADGNTTTLAYNAAGELTSLTDALNETTLFSYDTAGNRTQTTGPAGTSLQWTYDQQGRVLTSTDANGAVISYTYSPAGLLLTITDPTGAVTTITYDAAGLVATIADPLGRVTSFEYDTDGNLTATTDAAGAVTKAAYDALGRLTSLTDATGGVTTLSYDEDGNQVAEETPAGITRITYDSLGNALSVTSPSGATAQYVYDEAGRLIQATGPDGGIWTTTYDAIGNVISSANPLGAVTKQAWTPAGNVASGTDAIGRTTSYALDKDEQVTAVTGPDGLVTTYVYDANGRKISATTPAGLVTTFSHDDAGHLVATTDPRGWITRTEYSARGEKIATISPDGAVARFAYDAAGQLTEVIDPNGSVTRYTYDEAGHLISVTDAKGAVTRYTYDGVGRMTSVTDPLGRVTRSEYDEAGNLVTLTDPAGIVQHFSYDAGRRLILKTAPGAVDISFTYDSAGRRGSMTDATGTTRYTYDAAGRLLTVTEPDGSTTTAGYDAAGQRTSLTYPDGLRVSYGYDANGRLTSVQDSRGQSAVYALDADGRLITEQLPGRLARRYHYEAGLVHRFVVIHEDHPAAETTFTRDPNGRIASQRDGERLTRYRYDPAGQLIGIIRGDDPREALHLTYDAVGNRVSLRHGDRETHYRYDAADQLTGSESGGRRSEYRYDSSGSLTEEVSGDVRRTIAYDGFGRPVTVTRTTPALTERAEATFNGDGLLTSLVLTNEDPRRDEQRSASANYLWGGFGSVPQVLSQRAAPALDDAEHDHAERLSADFVYGYGRTFASNEHERAVFHHDPYGSELRTPHTAAWAQADRYDAFGAPAEEYQEREGAGRGRVPRLRSPELPRFGYRGELALGDAIDLRARTYDTALGRFTSRDPVIPVTGPSQAANPYAYANNDPLNSTDPLGTLAFAFSAPGDVASFAEAAAAATPALRVPPAPECPAGPSPATLNRLSAALKQGNFTLIASLLQIPRQDLFPKPPPPALVPQFVPNNGPECARFGLNCGGKIVMVPVYNNQNTAIPLGFEFWTGFGGRTQYFNQWDPFTQMLMKDPCVQQTIGVIKSALQCGGPYASTVEYKDPHNVFQVFKDLAGAFTDGRIGSNPADGFLGSYAMAWAAVPASAHSATAFFTVSNLTDLNSVFHPELLTGGAIRSVDGARPEFAFLLGPIPGGLFTAIGFRPTTQLIQWQETISY